MTYIGNTPPVNAYTASGLWTPNQVAVQNQLEQWAPAADPYFGNVVFLMQPKAGDTAIVDRSAAPKTITANGNAALSGARAFDGGASVLFPSGANLSLTDAAFAFGTGDFCVEVLFKPSTATGTQFIFDTRTSGTTGGSFLYWTGTQWATGYDAVTPVTGGTPAAGALHYAAVSRTSGTLYLHMNGVRIGSAAVSNNFTNGAFRLGNQYPGTNYPFVGDIYAARVTTHGRGYTGSTIAVPRRPFSAHSKPLDALLTGTPAGTHTALGGLAAAFDGTTAQAATACAQTSPSANGFGNTIGLTLAAPKRITAFKAWGPTDAAFFTGSSGALKLQGYNGSTWVDLWSGFAPTGSGATMDLRDGIDLAAGPVSQVRLDITGNGVNSTRFAEVQFFGY